MDSGQHLGVTKCNITCHKMTSPIPVARLIHYRPNQESCGKRAIMYVLRITRVLRRPWDLPTLSCLPHPGIPAKGLGKCTLVAAPQATSLTL